MSVTSFWFLSSLPQYLSQNDHSIKYSDRSTLMQSIPNLTWALQWLWRKWLTNMILACQKMCTSQLKVCNAAYQCMCITMPTAMRVSKNCEGTIMPRGTTPANTTAKALSAVQILEWSPCADFNTVLVEICLTKASWNKVRLG